MKLTKAQEECLRKLGKQRLRARDSYKPTAALTRAGLVRRLPPTGFSLLSTFEITPAGLSALAEQEKTNA